jgi:hypothetical protein
MEVEIQMIKQQVQLRRETELTLILDNQLALKQTCIKLYSVKQINIYSASENTVCYNSQQVNNKKN